MNSWIHPYLKLDQSLGVFSYESNKVLFCWFQWQRCVTCSWRVLIQWAKGLVSGLCEVCRGTLSILLVLGSSSLQPYWLWDLSKASLSLWIFPPLKWGSWTKRVLGSRNTLKLWFQNFVIFSEMSQIPETQGSQIHRTHLTFQFSRWFLQLFYITQRVNICLRIFQCYKIQIERSVSSLENLGSGKFCN